MRVKLPHWMTDAACAGNSADAVEFRKALAARDHTRAKMLCLECPVRLQCLQWALERRELWDVWGGLAEGEIRRALSVNAAGECIVRSRAPQCPACWVRTGRLAVVGAVVSCGACGFTWRSKTTARAVRAYYTARQRRKRLV